MKDKFSRDINYMRISVTDRCNMRCCYCMPNGIKLVSMDEILTYEEIIYIVKAAVTCGITRLKITGGEPLVRRGVVDFIHALKNLSGVEQVTMTTNGALLPDYMDGLRNAGLDSVNISLDTLNRERFEFITGFDLLERVKQGIDAAVSSGIPTKINTVLQHGLNFDEWDELLQFAKDNPVYVRFIELMPIGEGKNFHAVSNLELIAAITNKYKNLTPDSRVHGNGPAKYMRIPGFAGGVGFISALCEKFCASCNRIRLTARGLLKPCLSYGDAVDLREIIRTGDKNKLISAITNAINMKPQGHCFYDTGKFSEQRRMYEIGG